MGSASFSSGKHFSLPYSKMPFVLFRLPGSENSMLWGQSSPQIKTFSNLSDINNSTGFVFAPFIASENLPILFLEPDLMLGSEESIKDFLNQNEEKGGLIFGEDNTQQTDKHSYLEKIKKLILILKSGSAEKVVFSRTTSLNRLSDQQLISLYNILYQVYPDAFVFLIHFPVFGTWMGASPETLISCYENQCKTVALAGTRKSGSAIKWGSKEKEEQAIVERYIRSILVKHEAKHLTDSGAFTKQAGAVEHLCTNFFFDLPTHIPLSKLVSALHPTPAVCGTPKEKALELIAEFENSKREYYTGILGPVNYHKQTNLFVNLRCMKISSSQMVLFAGGGITKDSDPEKEWEETEIKTQTLLSVIEKIKG